MYSLGQDNVIRCLDSIPSRQITCENDIVLLQILLRECNLAIMSNL
jgi:hypothetical protein